MEWSNRINLIYNIYTIKHTNNVQVHQKTILDFKIVSWEAIIIIMLKTYV